jgi:hypothetical protein
MLSRVASSSAIAASAGLTFKQIVTLFDNPTGKGGLPGPTRFEAIRRRA